jgi:hypothetical protein
MTVFASAAQAARLHPVNWPGPVKAWLCIHRFEGSWTDDGWPHWGGLQMDEGFMRTYGLDFIRKRGGYANTWTPREQMIAANRARVGVDWRGSSWPGERGFTPWPRTARFCGLL